MKWYDITLCLVLLLPRATHIANGFLLNSRQSHSVLQQQKSVPSQRHYAVPDPNAMIQHAMDLQQQHASIAAAASDSSSISSAAAQHVESLLSTMVTTGVAHGHSNPWFGPPDPYLEAGKSIVPQGAAKMPLAPTLPLTLPQGVAETPFRKEYISDLSNAVQEIMSKGDTKIMDASKMTPQTNLPGFQPLSGFLPSRNPPPPQTLNSFMAQGEWVITKGFINVFDKLPLAAFLYCGLEFGVLRRNVFMYKSEIEEESPTSLWADTLATLTVRMVAMGFVTAVTLALFG